MTDTRETASVIQAIMARRSVRSYLPQAIARATVVELLSAAVRAPTAVHREPWAFVVVQDAPTLKRLSDKAKPLFVEEARHSHLDRGGHSLEMFMSPEFNIFYNAGTLIVICGATSAPFAIADCWLAAENLMLAARALGLGTCVIGSALGALNLPDVRAELGIPAEFAAIAPIIVGVPSGETPSTSRNDARILFWN